MAKIRQSATGDLALTFDDVLLRPAHSEIMPSEVTLRTRIAKDIFLNLPLLSAAMDTVTQSSMAIAMAKAGGIGILHRNMGYAEQAEEVRKVKRFVSGMVVNPLTIDPEASLQEAKALMHQYTISGVPVVEKPQGEDKPGRLVGILTNRDVRFASNLQQKVRELMTYENLVTVRENVSHEEAKKLLHQNRIEKLLVVDENNCCIGLITVKDIEKAQLNPLASKDDQGRLRVGAASTVGKEGIERIEHLVDAGADIIVIDTAHGHSQRVLESVSYVKKNIPNVVLMAGNVATAEATRALIDCGADAIKVGIGPGSICTTRIVAGVGIPQLSAIMECFEVAQKSDIPIIADGGIKYSGDFAKALAAGAAAAMIGSLLAGTDETPGSVYLYKGRSFKAYRGMGSVAAMAHGSADRYFQGGVRDRMKLVPEGVEGQVAYKGPVETVLHQLAGGLRASMGYVGAPDLKEFVRKAEFTRISSAGLQESHTHNVAITRESPNYGSKI